MATRRCFSKDIVESDVFLELPLSAQALYFHLGMNADDRGYVSNPKTVMRTIGANAGDVEILVAKKLVLIRQETLILIKGWRIHNVIQPSKLIETKYIEDLKKLYYDENKSYTEHKTPVSVLPCHQFADNSAEECRQNAGKSSANRQPNIIQDNLSKDNLIKDNLKIETDRNDKSNLSLPEKLFEKLLECEYANILDKEEYIELFKDLLANYEVKDIKTKLYYFIDHTCELHYDSETKRSYYKLEKPIISTYPYFEKSIRLALEKQ